MHAVQGVFPSVYFKGVGVWLQRKAENQTLWRTSLPYVWFSSSGFHFSVSESPASMWGLQQIINICQLILWSTHHWIIRLLFQHVLTTYAKFRPVQDGPASRPVTAGTGFTITISISISICPGESLGLYVNTYCCSPRCYWCYGLYCVELSGTTPSNSGVFKELNFFILWMFWFILPDDPSDSGWRPPCSSCFSFSSEDFMFLSEG